MATSTLTAIRKQSLKHALRENFRAYPENYPTSGGGPSEEGISNMVNWVENEYSVPDQGYESESIDEWFDIAIDEYINYFEFQDGDFDESGATLSYVRETVNSFRNDD
jgi:hypothetical protein